MKDESKMNIHKKNK